MKPFAFLSVLFLSLSSLNVRETAALPTGLNVLTDLATYIGLPNLNGDSTNGDAKKLQDVINYLNNNNYRVPLFFPAGTYRLDSTVYLQNDIKLIGVHRWTRFVCTNTLPTSANMLEAINGSRIRIEKIYFTNNHFKEMNAFVQFKASSEKCYGNTVIDCFFDESWVHAALMFGQAANSDSTHFNDNVIIDGCAFTNLYNPSYQIITTDLGNDNLHCRGINLQQTTLRSVISNSRFERTSGDGVYGYGSNLGMKNMPTVGSTEIKNCYFFRNFMNIEVIGPYYSKNVSIHDNRLYYSTYNGGYNISYQARGLDIFCNEFLNADRTFIEYGSVGGSIHHNKGKLICWSDTSQGVQPTAVAARVSFVEHYGFNNKIENNDFTEDRSNPNSKSAAEFNNIKLIARANGGNVNTQDTSFQDVTDMSAYIYIRNNNFIGATHKVLDATNERIRNLYFENNTVISNEMVESPIQIYGPNWNIIKNTFNLTGSPAPTGSNAVVKRRNATDAYGEVVDGNKLIGSAWYGATSNYKFLFQ